MHQLDLGNICSSLVGESKVTVFNSFDGFIDTCGVNDTLGVRLVGNTSELEVRYTSTHRAMATSPQTSSHSS